jgi:alginate O-acetyltransferase complex protein AlgI
MDFLSVEYGAFLICIAVIYWLTPHLQARLGILLTASLLFYTLLQRQSVALLIVSTLINFGFGWMIKRSRQRNYRIALLSVGVCFNVLLLLGFKYISFLMGNIGILSGWQGGIEISDWASRNVIVPIAISFFSFEMIAYLVDVYRGIAPAQDFWGFFTYKSFFPKLLSGPIVRYQDFAPQLVSTANPKLADISEGLWLIAAGAIKKGLIADNMGRFVDISLANIERAGSVDLWLALVGFGLQIYFDFSGYIDIARGSALLLGFKLPQNFDFPYLAASISEFWRRWNITLGHWLRDLVYIPLGGSRRGLIITCLNLLIVMLVAGIWHGAQWGFIIWGVLHGFYLVAHRLLMVAGTRINGFVEFWRSTWGKILGIVITQFAVLISWIPFRLPKWADMQVMLNRLWGQPADPQFGLKIYVETLQVTPAQIGLLGVAIVVAMIFAYRCDRAKWQLTWQAKLFLVPISLYLVAMLAPQNNLPFIYFDF